MVTVSAAAVKASICIDADSVDATSTVVCCTFVDILAYRLTLLYCINIAKYLARDPDKRPHGQKATATHLRVYCPAHKCNISLILDCNITTLPGPYTTGQKATHH